jgi:hypothetical protein
MVTKPTTTEKVEDVVLEMVETKVEEDLPHTTLVRMTVAGHLLHEGKMGRHASPLKQEKGQLSIYQRHVLMKNSRVSNCNILGEIAQARNV